MISYCPIEEDPPIYKQQSYVQNETNDDDTECNYLVLFFIIGVISLAITDRIGN